MIWFGSGLRLPGLDGSYQNSSGPVGTGEGAPSKSHQTGASRAICGENLEDFQNKMPFLVLKL